MALSAADDGGGVAIENGDARRIALERSDHLRVERVETHNAFHAAFVERCATRRLKTMIDQVRPHIHRYEYMYAGLVGPDYSHTFAEHRAIVRAIRTGGVAQAEQAVRANWLNSARRLSAAVSRLPSFGDFASPV